MKNKKLRLLSTCIASVTAVFGGLYQFSLANSNNSNDVLANTSVAKNHQSSVNGRNLIPFNEIVTGSSIKGHVGYETNEEDKTIRITYANGISGQNIKFRNTITNVGDEGKTYRLESIAPRAFSYDVATKAPANISGTIDFGSSLRVIGDEAFKDCIGLSGQLIFPQSLESIGDSAFSGCTEFNDSLSLPTNLKYLGASAFNGCAKLSKQVTIGKNVTKIYDNTFQGCAKITRIVLPSTLTSIGVSAFSGCSLLSDINVPTNVSSIGSYAFQNCTSLLNVDLSCQIDRINGYLFSGCNKLQTVIIPNQVTSIGNFSFASCAALKEIAFPEELTSIGVSAFSGCSTLTDIALPAKLTTLNSYAFFSCTNLGKNTQLFIPESVTEIGLYCFRSTGYNTSTTNNVLYSVDAVGYKKWFIGYIGINPSTVTTPTTLTLQEKTYGIASGALRLVAATTRIDFTSATNTLTYMCTSAFSGMTGLTTVNSLELCNSLKAIPGYAFYNSTNLATSISLPQNLESIGNYAFGNCSSMPSLNIPINAGRTTKCTIGNYAFSGCTKLGSTTGSEITIPSYVNEIGYKAFQNTSYKPNKDEMIYSKSTTGANLWCIGVLPSSVSSVTNINLDKNTYGIAGGAFEGCIKAVKLTYITPVQFIGTSAFSGCTALKTLADETLSGTLHKIGAYAFKDCSLFEAPKFLELTNSKVEYIGTRAFENCAKITGGIALPSTLNYIGARAFAGCKSAVTAIVNAGSKMTNFGTEVFAECDEITDGSIYNDSITKLPNGTFKNCTKLLDFKLADSITEIGESAFEGCIKLQRISSDGLSAELKTIGTAAFKGCKTLKTVELNDGLETIGSQAFYDCYDLNNTITIPKSVKNIQSEAFAGENELTKMIFASSEPCKLGYNWVAYDKPELPIVIQIPYGSKDAYFTNNIGIQMDNLQYYELNPNDFKFKVLNDALDVVVNTTKTYYGESLFNISVNDGASNQVKYSLELESTGAAKPLPEWISIEEETGTIVLENPGITDKYYFKVTATSVQNPNISEVRSISVNVFKNSIIDNWWIWLIIVISCVGVIVLLAWLMTIVTRKDNKKLN